MTHAPKPKSQPRPTRLPLVKPKPKLKALASDGPAIRTVADAHALADRLTDWSNPAITRRTINPIELPDDLRLAGAVIRKLLGNRSPQDALAIDNDGGAP